MTPRIRRVTQADAAGLAELMSAPEIFGNLLQMPYASEELWRKRLSEPSGPNDIVLVAEVDGRLVGSAGLHAVGATVRRRHAMMLGISVARDMQGQGLGSELMRRLLDYADHWAQVLRIELTVYTDNASALRLYRRFGFEIEGTMRGYALRAGRYADVYTLARLHPSPPAWGPAPTEA